MGILEGPIWKVVSGRIRIRIKLKGKTRIHIKVKSRIRVGSATLVSWISCDTVPDPGRLCYMWNQIQDFQNAVPASGRNYLNLKNFPPILFYNLLLRF
jgi:hypothetical protein